jgi:hypothetical protein
MVVDLVAAELDRVHERIAGRFGGVFEHYPGSANGMAGGPSSTFSSDLSV